MHVLCMQLREHENSEKQASPELPLIVNGDTNIRLNPIIYFAKYDDQSVPRNIIIYKKPGCRFLVGQDKWEGLVFPARLLVPEYSPNAGGGGGATYLREAPKKNRREFGSKRTARRGWLRTKGTKIPQDKPESLYWDSSAYSVVCRMPEPTHSGD
ncbi:uncharacterized protein EI90DRAFT_1308543 [Cantharellus anzutake]|uniref:uncharacterized protein n=1 Tax=Cantharellus anzutake TaxID=1750568 RepID=UPI00190394BE|nr:uncharacterized protein EI90DRAFT_1308543 [Cantharellus anzutake]KAF8342163.1 hypothetical protein EI90DRAFT_1308543 [Cantharellus anzutake]